MTAPYDIVVVGAGPAGSVAARELARLGRRVLLLDQSLFPRPKVCGCCLNDSARSTLQALGLGDLLARCGAVPLTHVCLATGGRQADVTLPGGVALSRDVFDVALITEARTAGVTFRSGVRVTPELLDSGRLDADHVWPTTATRILATGLNSQLVPVRPQVETGSRIGAGAILSTAPANYDPGRVFMAVGRGGYVGLVRLEDDRLDVAAAFDSGFLRRRTGPGSAAAAILAEAGLPAIPGIETAAWRGTPTLTRTTAQVAGERWFAIGDAAGYVEPFTGEGMAWALASGRAVAPIAATPWSPTQSQEWARTHQRLIRSRQGLCRVVARVLRSPTLTRLAVPLLNWLPGLARPVLTRLNRPHRVPRLTPEYTR